MRLCFKLSNFNIHIMAWHDWWTSHTFAPMDCVKHGYGKWVLGPWPWGWELPKLSEILPNSKSDFYTRHIDVRANLVFLNLVPIWTSNPFFSNGDGFYMDGNGDLFGENFVFIYKWKYQYHYLMVYKQVD